MEGAGPRTTGRWGSGCGARVPAGTGLKTAVGATLLGRWSSRTRSAELRWPRTSSSSILIWSGSELDGGDGGGGLDHLGRDGGPAAEVGLRGLGGGRGCALASARRAPGKSVLPRPAAVVTARRRRRVASIG